ncbi:MAG TPA: molybdopterin-guanine dinucleotide biosynthesis protein B [Aestuariivirgaceae bacterium]|nr:molybdopterin-guanine dinucleotide biosynthesis protein B [Aestuariivirgaceae bacterium]
MKRKVIGIAGYKKSGKTTLVERLVAEFTARGLGVATVKHAHHAFDIDHKGRDSWRHRAAGAHEVAIVSDRMWAIIHPLQAEPEPRLDDILAKMAPSDLVLIEGYKRENYPKIEVRDAALGHPELAPGDATVIAIAATGEIAPGKIPVFSRDDVTGIADFIEAKLDLELPKSQP